MLFCHLLTFFFKLFFSKSFFQEHFQSVTQFEYRPGPTLCQSWSGFKLFAKVIRRYLILNLILNYFFPKVSFKNTFRVSHSLNIDQDQRYVGPGLGSNCLQRLSADNKSVNASKGSVNCKD